jgi:hypothetical protein
MDKTMDKIYSPGSSRKLPAYPPSCGGDEDEVFMDKIHCTVRILASRESEAAGLHCGGAEGGGAGGCLEPTVEAPKTKTQGTKYPRFGPVRGVLGCKSGVNRAAIITDRRHFGHHGQPPPLQPSLIASHL